MEEDVESGNPNQSAVENLQVIRDLMERATVYRAVSAVPALVGGGLALVLGLGFVLFGGDAGKTAFVLAWIGVLIVVGVLNTWLFYRDCQSKGAEFPSPQMKHGLLAMGPPMIVMGSFGLAAAWVDGELVRGVVIWVFGYGLGLLATSSFAPASIKSLGWQFLVFGSVFFVAHVLKIENCIANAAIFMALSFGLLNVIYGFRTLREPKREI